MPHQNNNREMQECISNCQECADICLRTTVHCLQIGEQHASPDHQTLLNDCADICATATRFMGRNSHYHTQICRVCAEVCQSCADECDRLADGDQMMKECSQVCRRCAQSCERMAGVGV